jgi:sulfate adenylyltransferase subunit 1
MATELFAARREDVEVRRITAAKAVGIIDSIDG